MPPRWFAARAAGTPLPIGRATPPLRPARPAKPELAGPARRAAPPPRHRPPGRIALLHAVAHIELNAVDLHWDIIARFADQPMPMGFYDDWVQGRRRRSQAFQPDLRLS